MKILITESDRQVVMYSDNIIFEDDVYYAWNNDKPHKVTRANTTNTLEIVSLPEDVELPDDEIFFPARDPTCCGQYHRTI